MCTENVRKAAVERVTRDPSATPYETSGDPETDSVARERNKRDDTRTKGSTIPKKRPNGDFLGFAIKKSRRER